MNRRAMRIAIVSMALVLLFLGVWALTYPSGDPKSIGYVLWKLGLYKMNLNVATSTMTGDAGRNRLVIGRTETELQSRFGHLLAPGEATQYLRSCYQDSGWKDKKVRFIRNSSWMVVFDGDKATDLVLIKGC
jgi:hypothetical protein